MKITLAICLSILLSSSIGQGRESHAAHVHGKGDFNVVIDGNQVQVELKIPASDIVGFEHSPTGDEERSAVKSAVSQLEEASNILMLPEAAGCKLKSANVESQLKEQVPEDRHSHEHEKGHSHSHDQKSGHHHSHEPKKVHEHSHDHAEGHDHDHSKGEHADFQIGYRFECEKPQNVRQITLKIFKPFPRVLELKAQAITATGQFSHRLTSDSPILELK